VDPGDFAAPGAPLVTVLDTRRLRVRVSAAPDGAVGIRRGDSVQVTIEGVTATAVVEGVAPDAAASLVTVNAVVDNASGVLMPGGAATLHMPRGLRRAILIPAAAVLRQSDLTGVRVRTAGGAELRWVRLGATRSDGTVEVLSGLRPGEVVLLPDRAGAGEAAGDVASNSVDG
jgi:hypothetical protein